MTGLEEFEKIFGNITVLNVLELALAVAFVIFLYKNGKTYKVLREMTVTPGWEPPALLNDFYEEVVE